MPTDDLGNEIAVDRSAFKQRIGNGCNGGLEGPPRQKLNGERFIPAEVRKQRHVVPMGIIAQCVFEELNIIVSAELAAPRCVQPRKKIIIGRPTNDALR